MLVFIILSFPPIDDTTETLDESQEKYIINYI